MGVEPGVSDNTVRSISCVDPECHVKMMSTKARHEQLRNKSVVSDIMGRRTAARVVPTADLTSSTCSSNSAIVFTPVVPVEHVAENQESGAASSSRCREDGQEYVLHLREPHAVQYEKRDVGLCCPQDGRGSRGWGSSSNGAQRSTTE
jgi:hypothetical protein